MKDIKAQSISVQGVNVFIENLSLENEELAEYLLENGATEEVLIAILNAGVSHMNLLKGSIEKNLMKEQVKSIEKNMAKTLNEAVNDISNEAEKYLDINAFYEIIVKEYKNVYTTDEEKEFMGIFIKNYELLLLD